MNTEQPLVDRYLDGELTPEEQARLVEWLAADAGHVRQFVRAASLHRQIRETMLARPYRAYGLAEQPSAEPKARPASVPVSCRLNRSLVAADVRRRISGKRSALSPRRLRYERAAKPFLLALAASIVVMAGLWMFGPTMGEPVLAEVNGVGLLLERAGQPIPAVAGVPLQTGDELRTPANVTAVIGFGPENTRVTLQPETELTLTKMSHGKRFALGAGKLEAMVARQRPWQPMILLTAQAEARVLGTKFTLAAKTNATRLEVTEGKVKLTRTLDDKSVNVRAGYYAVAASNYALATHPLPGKVLREVWLDLPGDSLQDLRYHARYPNAPSGHDFPPSFETHTNWPGAYGTRMRAYLLPPANGDYEFSLSDDAWNGQVSLFLSPDEEPADKQKICQIVFTRNRPGDESPRDTRSQLESGPIPLQAGMRYYIEVLHKYGTGEDRLTIQWKHPGGKTEPIPSAVLSPFNASAQEGKR